MAASTLREPFLQFLRVMEYVEQGLIILLGGTKGNASVMNGTP